MSKQPDRVLYNCVVFLKTPILNKIKRLYVNINDPLLPHELTTYDFGVVLSERNGEQMFVPWHNILYIEAG